MACDGQRAEPGAYYRQVTADHVKLSKRALLEAGLTPATVARRLSVLRGAYPQRAAKGLVAWEPAQDIAAIKASGVQKNSTPSRYLGKSGFPGGRSLS
jgi:site-specific recombinase XerC